MSFVKLTAKYDTYFIPGTELFEFNTHKRFTVGEYYATDRLLVCGDRKSEGECGRDIGEVYLTSSYIEKSDLNMEYVNEETC